MRPRTAILRNLPVFLGSVLLFAACIGPRHSAPAPELSPELFARGQTLGFAANELEHGRAIFKAECNSCHRLPAVDGESPEEWEKVIPRMAKKAGLDAEETAAVRAFVLAARPPGS
jgi:cytochrome c5